MLSVLLRALAATNVVLSSQVVGKKYIYCTQQSEILHLTMRDCVLSFFLLHVPERNGCIGGHSRLYTKGHRKQIMVSSDV